MEFFRYDFEVTSVAYGKECSTPFSIWDSTYPAPPVEIPSSRTFDTTEISLEVDYTGDVEVRPTRRKGFDSQSNKIFVLITHYHM